ncbi:MAG: hypothetical protein ACREIA_23415 [Opitutaceae bacterium]
MFLLRAVSFLLACLPEFAARGLTAVLAEIVFWCIPRRRRPVLSNLSHAFPDKPHRWLVCMGRRSFRRMIETGLLALIYPQLERARIQKMVTADGSLLNSISTLVNSGRASVLAIPHLGAWDFCSAIPLLYSGKLPHLGAIYRRLRNRNLDDWVRGARERFGVRMLSRKAGFNEGMQILRRGGALGILFDQNARDSGALSLLFGRVCSTTNLPGLLAEKFAANLAIFFTRRLGFWRYELAIRIEENMPREADAITAGLDRWLEETLRSDEELSSTWLWVHNRWKTQVEPRARFRLDHKRSILPAGTKLPRATRFFVRLPDLPEAAREALPFLAALRESRPDAALTALAPGAFAETARASGVFEEVIPLPDGKLARLALARRLRRRYPDCWIVLADDGWSALEARFSACPQRFGFARPGQRGFGLTDTCEVAASTGRSDFEAFFRHFGMREKLASTCESSSLRHLPS